MPAVSDDDSASVAVGQRLGSIGDLVWHDLNVDGYPNFGEPGIPGVQVCLYPDDGDGVLEPGEIAAHIGCQTTNANGEYTFVGVPAGSYLVRRGRQQLPAGRAAGGHESDQPLHAGAEPAAGDAWLQARTSSMPTSVTRRPA